MVTLAEHAQRLRVTYNQALAMALRGEIAAVKVGGHWLVRVEPAAASAPAGPAAGAA